MANVTRKKVKAGPLGSMGVYGDSKRKTSRASETTRTPSARTTTKVSAPTYGYKAEPLKQKRSTTNHRGGKF